MALEPRKARPKPIPLSTFDVGSGREAGNNRGYPNAPVRRRLPPARFEGDAPPGVPPQETLDMQPGEMFPTGPPLPAPSTSDLSAFARRRLPAMGGMGGWQGQAEQQAGLRSLYTEQPQAPQPPVAPAEPRRRWQRPATQQELDTRMQEAQRAQSEGDLRKMERRARHPGLINFMREFSQPGIIGREMEARRAREEALAKAYLDAGLPRPAGGFTGRSITDPATYEDLWAGMEDLYQADRRLKLQRERAMMLRAMDVDAGQLLPEGLWHILNDEVLDAKWLKIIPRGMPQEVQMGGFNWLRDRFSGKMTKGGPIPAKPPATLPKPGEPFWDPSMSGGRGGPRMLPVPANPAAKAAQKTKDTFDRDLKTWDKEHYNKQQEANREIAEAELEREQAMQRLEALDAFRPDGSLDPAAANPEILKERQAIDKADRRIAWYKNTLKEHEARKPQPPAETQPAGSPGEGGPQPPVPGGQPLLDGETAIEVAGKWYHEARRPAKDVYNELRGMGFPDNLARIAMAEAGIPAHELGPAQPQRDAIPQIAPSAPMGPGPTQQPVTQDNLTTDDDVIGVGQQMLSLGYDEAESMEAMESLLKKAGFTPEEAEDSATWMLVEAQMRLARQQEDEQGEGEEEE